MRLLLVIFSILFLHSGTATNTFREGQKVHTRVRQAYAEKEKIITKELAKHLISKDSLRIYLRAFKTEKKLELWAKNRSDSI